MIRLGVAGLLLALSVMPGTASEWIEHASRPGPDLPPLGQSRFDDLFGSMDGSYRLPYPYQALVAELAARLDNGGHSGVRQVLIPLGRSLQRDAAGPHYFRQPRAVLALEGEPVIRPDAAGHVLEYRLFLAHQPASATLEVISYNDALGRFEFQVVENYSADSKPEVRYAGRAMCMSCHQNGGPIFSAIPWSETSDNLAVAQRLLAASPGANRSPIGLISNDAGVIDVLAERANYLSAAQFVWREACDSPACRGAMLRAILQYRLSGGASFASTDTRFRRDYFDTVARNWHRRWPQGIALASSRIPDRDPFASDSSAARLDPLALRPAQASWSKVDPILAHGIIFRLAGFFTAADIERIDRHLRTQATHRNLPTRRLQASCKTHSGEENGRLLYCGTDLGADTLRAEIEVEFERQRPHSVRVRGLQVPGDTNIWQPRSTALRVRDRVAEVELVASDANLSQRLADGTRISRFALAWRGTPAPREFSLELELTNDFELIDDALDQILEAHRRGDGESLGGGAFRRAAVLPELHRALAMKRRDWAPTPSLAFDAATSAASLPDPDLQFLYPYCGRCHLRAGRFPPGFLAAPGAKARTIRCAPRMLARLRAWRDHRVMPMPPPAALPSGDLDAQAWIGSDSYRRLVGNLEQLVAKHYAADAVRASDYAALPQCSGEP